MKILPKMKEWKVIAIYKDPYGRNYANTTRWILLQNKAYPSKGLLVWNRDVGTRIHVCIEGMMPAYDGWRNSGFSAVCVCESCRRYKKNKPVKKLQKIVATAKKYGIEVVFTRHEFVVGGEEFFREMRIKEAQQLGLDLEKWQDWVWCIK